jgi:hypothetical protein
MAAGRIGESQLRIGVLMGLKIFACVLLLATGAAFADVWPTLPDHDLTRGKTVPGMTVEKICSTKWGTDARHVTSRMKQAVIDKYHFEASSCPLTTYKGKRDHRVEIDHLVSRELGGADEVDNLWPECYELVKQDKSKQADGAYKKDRLENKLHNLICAAIPSDRAALLSEYQQKIADDWIALYHDIFGNR